MKFDTLSEVLEDLRAGKMVIVTDDLARENEGDLVFAAERADWEKVEFMVRNGGIGEAEMASTWIKSIT